MRISSVTILVLASSAHASEEAGPSLRGRKLQSSGNLVCHATGFHTGYTDAWCNTNCNHVNPNCPAQFCSCDGPAPAPAPTLVCHVTGSHEGYTDAWCNTNCNHVNPNCPAEHCSCIGDPAPAPGPAPISCDDYSTGTCISDCEVTFYGAADNCPPGGNIAYAQPGRPTTASGNAAGTYSDPITFASDQDNPSIPPGTIIYVPRVQKYYIMEDFCYQCIEDWKVGKWHVDLWMGPIDWPPIFDPTKLVECENQMSRATATDTIIINPASDLPVSSTPVFSDAGVCMEETTPCVETEPNVCGNSCMIPATTSCPALETMFVLTADRFAQLNEQINIDYCESGDPVPKDTRVCMGGTCGGR